VFGGVVVVVGGVKKRKGKREREGNTLSFYENKLNLFINSRYQSNYG